MKKLFVFAIAAIATFALASCGEKKTDAAGDNADSTATEVPAQEEAAAPATRDFDNEFFSFTAPEGWTTEERSSGVRMEKDDASITISTSTISFDEFQKNHEKDATNKEITAAGLTWKTYANDQSKLYYLATDIASEPEKCLYINTFQVTPDDPAIKELIETVKLKK